MSVLSTKKTAYMTSPAGGQWYIDIQFQETSVEDNKSNIYVVGHFGATSGNFAGESANELKVYWHDNNMNVDVLLSTQKPERAGATYGEQLINGIYSAEHKADGTLSGYAKAVWTKKSNSQYVPSSKSVQTDLTPLTPIEQGSLRIGVNGNWVKAKVYLGVNGSWKLCQAYIGNNGTWQKGI